MTTFGSVCSGIEAASVAFHPLGWRAAWFSEIEAFPSAVLAHHYPEVPNLGDMTKIAKAVLLGEVHAPDILCGGTPCQAFSVAGLRESLADDRGNLTLKFVELADAIDHVRGMRGKQPATVFWENVPGVLSTEDNAFGCFLAGLAGENGTLEPPEPRPASGRSSRHWKWNKKLGKHTASWSNAGAVYGPQRAVAWRTLDAQYFGLAQRRRRVFVVASARKGFDPATVLFEWDGLRRDSAPGREEREAAAGSLTASAGRRGGVSEPDRGQLLAYGGNRTSGPRDVASALSAHGGTGRHDFETETFVTHSLRGEGFDASEDGTGRGTPLVPVSFQPGNLARGGGASPSKNVVGTLTGQHGRGMSDQFPHVAVPIAYAPDLHPTMVARSSRGGGQTNSPGHNADETLVAVAFDTTQITSAANYSNPKPDDPCHPLAAGAHPPAIAFPANLSATQHASTAELSPSLGAANPTAVAHVDIMPTMTCGGGHEASHNQVSGQMRDQSMVPTTAMQVRRLTPVECERLMGFPDGYTQIPWKLGYWPADKHSPEVRAAIAEHCPDGPRYKALGNSWAVPNVAWIGRRIDAALRTLELAEAA